MATPDSVNVSDETGTATPYQKQIDKASRRFKPWRDAGHKCWQFYSKEKESQGMGSSQRRYALYWANINVLQPAVYSRIPEPVVQRRFKDQDEAGRLASEIMQRCLVTTMDQCEFNDIWEAVRDDNLIPGRGQARVRYEPKIGMGPNGGEAIVDEKAILDFVSYENFLHGQADKWGKVPWVAFGEWLSPSKWKEEFPTEPFQATRLEQGDEKSTDDDKALVWEFWDKKAGKICFVSPNHPDLLNKAGPDGKRVEKIDPYLDFSKFWPCPKPFYATLNQKDLIPQPDRRFYQDQLEEIDKLTNRIAKLEDMLKFIAFYAGGEDGQTTAAIEKAFGPGVENQAISIQGWEAMQQSGGIEKLIAYMPTDKIADLLIQCVELRRQLIDDVYQITGISDIARGDTDPRETLGAQQLKSQYGSIRVSDRQKGMERFIAECLQLTAEIIAENFQEETIAQMCGLRPTPPPEMQAFMQPGPGMEQQPDPEAQEAIAKFQKDMQNWQAAIELLRNDKMRGFRISVETDSTIQPNEQADKAARIEYLGAVGQFVQSTLPVVQQAPELVPMVGQMLLFTTRTFRAGRELEDEIETFVDKMNEEVKRQQENPQPPPPDPEQIKQQGETERAQIDANADVVKQQADVEKQRIKSESDALQAQQSEAAALRKHELDMLQQQTQREKITLDQGRLALDRRELDLKAIEVAGEEGDRKTIEGVQEMMAALNEAMANLQRTAVAPRRAVVMRDPETGSVIGAESYVETVQ